MTIYTIHTVELYKKLTLEKRLVNDGKYFDDLTCDVFLPHYEWMANQMQLHGHKKSEDAKYPFWGWYKYSQKKVKPDLRCGGLQKRGMESVCLQLELPDEKVFLSNFDTWHYILNNHPIFPEDEEFDNQYQKYKSLPLEEQEIVKLQTWKKVFSDFGNSPIQATFWELCIDDVVNVNYFKAR